MVSEEKKMTNQIFNQIENTLAENAFVKPHDDRNIIGPGWTKYHTGALTGLLGGFIVLSGAILLNVFDLFSGAKPHGIWLFLAIYPLFALGAHCLDKVTEIKKRKKIISDEAAARN